jgi:hypothetical protein
MLGPFPSLRITKSGTMMSGRRSRPYSIASSWSLPVSHRSSSVSEANALLDISKVRGSSFTTSAIGGISLVSSSRDPTIAIRYSCFTHTLA